MPQKPGKYKQNDKLREYILSQKPTAAEQQLARRIRAKIDNPTQDFIGNHSVLGHGRQRHRDIPDEQVLDRVLRGEQTSDAKFNDAETEDDCIKDLLYYRADAIAILISRFEPGDKVMFQMARDDPDDDKAMPIGYGFSAKTSTKDERGRPDLSRGVEKITSSVVGVVIKVDPYSDDGFEITSAFPITRIEPGFPDEDYAKIEPVQEDFTEILHKTQTFKSASPIDKVLMDYTCSGKTRVPGIAIRRRPPTRGPEEVIILSDDRSRDMRVSGGETLAASVIDSAEGRPKPETRQLANQFAEQVDMYSGMAREARQQKKQNDSPEF